MYSIKDSLKKSIKKLGVEKELRERRIVQLWDKLRRGELIKNTKASSFKNGILFVTVSSSVWSQQLIFLKADLIKEINRELGGNYLKDVRFQCGIIENNYQGEDIDFGKKDWQEINLEQEEIEEIGRISQEIKDERIRKKLESFLAQSKKLRKWREKEGWKLCLFCSCLYPVKEKKCPYCSLEKELKQVLYENPWIEFDRCQEMIVGLEEKEFREIKEKIIIDLENKLKSVFKDGNLQNINREKGKKWIKLAQIYVILRTGLELSAITKEIICKVLGPELAEVFYKIGIKIKEGA